MGSKDWAEITERLSQNKELTRAFKQVYPDGWNEQNITHAIAEFEKTLITPDSRFDLYLKGDESAITADEKRGYELFKLYRCASCHVGQNVGGASYEYLDLKADYFAQNDRPSLASDKGRFNFTGEEEDMHRFKVPSLRNIEHTFPYMHDGSVTSLDDAVQIMGKYLSGLSVPQKDRDLIVDFLRTLSGKLNGEALAGAKVSNNTHSTETKKLRIAIVTNPYKFREYANNSAIRILQKLSHEYDFEFLDIKSSESFEWVYNISEIHEENPLDLLIGVGWEASEVFPIIYDKYEKLHYIVLDNQVESPYIKSVYFSRYDCSYLIGAMIETAFPEEEVLGFISNYDTSYTNVCLSGYIDGLHSINPKIQVQIDYTKNYDNEMLAYELAKKQHQLGIKFSMSILSPKANLGIYKYAHEKEYTKNPYYTTCIHLDETGENKPFILTGIIENIELALRLVVTDFIYNGYSHDNTHIKIAENGVDVLFASTLDAHYRNREIMTDDVLKAGKAALQTIKEKNAH